MQLFSAVTARQFNSGDGFTLRAFTGGIRKFSNSGCRIVVGECDSPQTDTARQFKNFCRTQCAVGGGAVCV